MSSLAEDFLTRARARLDELRVRDGQLAAQERGIQQKRAQLAHDIVEVEAAIVVYQQLMTTPIDGGDQSEAPPEKEVEPERKAVLDPAKAKAMTISEAAEEVLRSYGGEADTQDILRELLAVGKVGGENPVNTLSTQLRRFPKRFRWVRRGRWRLLDGGQPPAPERVVLTHPDHDHVASISSPSGHLGFDKSGLEDRVRLAESALELGSFRREIADVSRAVRAALPSDDTLRLVQDAANTLGPLLQR